MKQFCEKHKKLIKRILGIITAAVLFATGINTLNFLYASPNLENRIMWESFYSQDGIDTVFIGSSLVFCGIDTLKYEELTGERAFDLSTGSQRLHEAYYNLIEADNRYDVRNVYLELDSMLETYMFGDYTNPFVKTSSWTDTDYMRLSLNKLRGVYDINGSEFLIQAYFPFTRYRAYLFDKDHILETVTIKRSDDYKNYTYRGNYPDGNGYHETSIKDKGYWHSTRVLENPVCIQAQKNEQMHITEDAERYLRKIIEYCQNNNIHLYLFMCPMYGVTPISTENYDIYFDSVREIADEYNILLYDFNLIKEDYLKLEQDDFFDVSHLNSKGADKFTRQFAKMRIDGMTAANPPVNETMYNSDESPAYFYSSFADKLRLQEPTVYGAYFNNMPDRVKLHIAASNRDDMEFKLTFKLNDAEGNPTGAEEPLQDYSRNTEYQFPLNVHGTFVIYTKVQGDENVIPPVECAY